MRQNMDMRFSAKIAQIPMRTIAKKMGIGIATLYRILDKPATDQQRQRFYVALNACIAERAEANP